MTVLETVTLVAVLWCVLSPVLALAWGAFVTVGRGPRSRPRSRSLGTLPQVGWAPGVTAGHQEPAAERRAAA